MRGDAAAAPLAVFTREVRSSSSVGWPGWGYGTGSAGWEAAGGTWPHSYPPLSLMDSIGIQAGVELGSSTGVSRQMLGDMRAHATVAQFLHACIAGACRSSSCPFSLCLGY